MSRQYHYLVAGLPELIFEDKKLVHTSADFRNYLSEHLPTDDMELINLLFWKYDNTNLLSRLNNPDAEINTMGVLSSNQLDEFIAAQKNDSIETLDFSVPEYLVEFIEAYKAGEAIYSGKSWDLQLTELYYNHVLTTKNSFVRNWFKFELDLSNILTAINCRNNNIPLEKQLVGSGELNEKLSKSSARDFGLTDEIDSLNKIQKALEETDLLEQEKKIDRVKWELIEDDSFFHFFTIEKLFTFLVKLSIVERWISLDKDTGLKLFEELLKNLESSYEFPGEFSLN